MALPFANAPRARVATVTGIVLLVAVIIVLSVALPLRNRNAEDDAAGASAPAEAGVVAVAPTAEPTMDGMPAPSVGPGPQMPSMGTGSAEASMAAFEPSAEPSVFAVQLSAGSGDAGLEPSGDAMRPEPSALGEVEVVGAVEGEGEGEGEVEDPPSQVEDGGLVPVGAEDDVHTLTYEHVAHAVPGRAYEAVDLDGDGMEEVMLDASRSHTHYFEPGPPPQLGVIVSWMWYEGDSDKVLSEASTPFLIFPLGVSKLRLKVLDNAGNSHEEKTTVTVNPSTREGVYCYYYNEVGEDGKTFTIEENVVNGAKPVLGTEVPAIDFGSVDVFPEEVSSGAFQVRCTFSVESKEETSARVSVQHHGPMRMLAEVPDGHDIVMDSFALEEQFTTTIYQLPAGLQALQIMYLKQAGKPGLLRLLDSPEPTLHNLATQLPLIYDLSPPNSTLAGGGILKVSGSGLWNDANVYFNDDVFLSRDNDRSTPEELFVTVPEGSVEGAVDVTVGNRMGGSNALPFLYDDEGLVPIKFEEGRLMKGGSVLKLKLITNLQYGPDHRLYLASLDSFVYSLELGKDMTASDICQSESLGEGRTVIGLAFNYADSEPVLYASSSIFFWETGGLGGDFPWANGQISRLAKNYQGKCLGIVGDPIITGLPVSNHDHGVNSMLFDDDGLLHFQVGAATNAGVPAATIGGIDESPLSAASLVADISAPQFDGNIVYDSTDPGTANVISGDVTVFAPGWRNSFDFILHSNGFLYGTENGANAEFGNRSTSCTESELISPYHSDDKLAKIIAGKFGGHANRNRGRTDPVQCVWRNPFEEATNNYTPPIATLESSTDGLIEYTADLFGGQMKGDLLASKFSTNDPNDDGRVYRIKLDEDGERVGPVDSLWEGSGLSIEMTPWGDILMNRLYDGEIMVLKAQEEGQETGRLISVSPFRGPVGGGNEVLVTVTGSGKNAVALFAGKECTSVREAQDMSFKCNVPPGKGGTSVQVSIRLSDGTVHESSGGYDYRYMSI